ncbi:MAG: hypothetical protein LBD98_03130 [Endomicrobium sp.]|jgi:hypothetical protein|nr:hypothetical protein [Endomicrobium sp.]
MTVNPMALLGLSSLMGGQQGQQQQDSSPMGAMASIVPGAVTGGMMGGPVGALAGGALSFLPKLFGGGNS